MKLALLKKVFDHKVFQTFGIYTGSSVLNKALPFMLMPIMTKYLLPAEYGTLAIWGVLITFASPFIGMSMQNNITREFYKVPKEKIAKIVGNVIFVVAVTSAISLAVVIIYTFFFKSLNDIPAKWLYAIPLLCFFGMINQLNLTVIRNEQRAFTYGLFEVTSTLIQLSLSVLFVVFMKWGWEGRAYATLIGAVLYTAIGFVHMTKTNYLKWDIDKQIIKRILHISLPMIPNALGGMIIIFSNRFFIDHWAGKTAVGIYAIGFSFAMIVTIFKDAFAKAWSPWMYSNLAHINEEGKVKIVRFTYLYMIGMVVLALVVTYGSYILMQFMANERYHGAREYIIWIALGNAVNGWYSVMMPYNIHLGKTKPLAWIMLSAALFNLIGNYFLIQLNGPVGAAQATLLAFCTSFAINWWHVQRIYPMPWFDKRVWDLNKHFDFRKELAVKKVKTTGVDPAEEAQNV